MRSAPKEQSDLGLHCLARLSVSKLRTILKQEAVLLFYLLVCVWNFTVNSTTRSCQAGPLAHNYFSE